MPGNLVCSNLTKKYEDGAVALERVSFTLETNGIFALIGRNGAGKTTLTRILATELLPTSGNVSIDGLDIVNDAGKLREKIAILPQEARAIPWLTTSQSILSYLLYRGFSYKDAKARVDKALAQLGIEKYRNTLNRLLSGGLKRKVMVAMILASEARILFVDEPTTGLDPLSRIELWKILNKIKKDHFIFLTTHYLEEAERLADKIGILENGRLRGIGTLDELRSVFKYQYSIRILQKNPGIKVREGQTIRGADGRIQVIVTEENAGRLSRELIRNKIKFSINPVSLEDIFYYLAKKPIGEESYEEE